MNTDDLLEIISSIADNQKMVIARRTHLIQVLIELNAQSKDTKG